MYIYLLMHQFWFLYGKYHCIVAKFCAHTLGTNWHAVVFSFGSVADLQHEGIVYNRIRKWSTEAREILQAAFLKY